MSRRPHLVADPTLEILADGRRVYIEAVCATAGDPGHAERVAEPVYRDASGRLVAAQVPHHRISLRIATSVRAKLDAFDRYRVGRHVTPDDACVVSPSTIGCQADKIGRPINIGVGSYRTTALVPSQTHAYARGMRRRRPSRYAVARTRANTGASLICSICHVRAYRQFD